MMDTDYHARREQAAEELFNNDFLSPHRYVLVLTNKCNLNCSFCFQDRKSLAGALTTEEWLSVIDDLPDGSWVTLTGGEPLAFKGFESVVNRLESRQINFNIISNGLLLNLQNINFLQTKHTFKGLSISIDDLGNKNRGFNPVQWDKLVNIIKEFIRLRQGSDSTAYIDVKTVVLDSNAMDLFEIYKYFSSIVKIDSHSFQFLKGSPVQHSDKMFDYITGLSSYHGTPYKNWDDIIASLKLINFDLLQQTTQHRVFLHPKFAVFGDERFEEKIKTAGVYNSPTFNKAAYRPCKALWESVHVNADGFVFPCLAIPFGNIKEVGLANIHNSEAALRIKKKIRSAGLVESCKGCGYLKPV